MAVKCPKCHSENPDSLKFCGECGTPLAPPSKTVHAEGTETLQAPPRDLATGSTFANRYQIIEELGRGGMGKVYKVFDTRIREKVALKLIKPEIAADRETIERFANELRLARRIRHKNVCGMYDLGESEGSHYITMEYVHGEDLKSMIRMSTGLTVGTVLSVGKQVCDGLSEAHNLGVVHRDLKPHNIMIDRGGNVKIMDFGIARSVREKGITGPSVMIGTPEYMSPEQAEAKEVDHRSDIYSLGIILYEMATGKVPFEGDTALSIAMKHKAEIPKNPRQLNPNIPDSLSNLILKCLEKAKEARYQTAADVRSELEKIEKGMPTTQLVVPKQKPLTSREITVKFSPKKLLVPGLMTAALIVAVAIIVRRVVPERSAAPARSARHSIAVLPFEDLSPTKDHEYLCDGIAETLINSLSRIENLWVPARASSFSFKGKNFGLHEIGRELAVDNLLEASVQVIGDKLRITPKIISVADGSQVWSAQYDRQMEDVFAIQDEIAREIVKALKITLLGEKEAPLIKSYTDDTDAYQAFLKGRFYWNKRTEEGMRDSIEYFQQAIVRDPSFALAYVGLADSYITLVEWRFLPAKEGFPKAKEAALKALEIDDSLGEAHSSLASVKYGFDWDWKGAEKEYKRAIELSPNYATAHQWYGEFLTLLGRFDEGLKEIKRAQGLDPLSLVMNMMEGWVYFFAGEYDKVIAQCQKTLEMDPDFRPAQVYLASGYAGKGMYEEALREAQKAGDPYLVASFDIPLNRQDEARRLLAGILKQPQQSEINVALIYFGLGENEEGWKWMDKAYEERSYLLTWLKVFPPFDPIRSNPKFQALLEKVGFQ